MCHITGGGLIENIPRILPDHLTARLTAGSWHVPAVFPWLAKGHQGSTIDAREMARTFNCGIGMVVVTAPDDAERVSATLAAAGETVAVIGELAARDGGDEIVIDGLDGDWLRGS
jgi:phosphoribosylformylglycinamidine cyclo-ligase